MLGGQEEARQDKHASWGPASMDLLERVASARKHLPASPAGEMVCSSVSPVAGEALKETETVSCCVAVFASSPSMSEPRS